MWRDGERGQSIQIGAVLLFAALIIALAGYQAFVVPQQNERVEFSHSQTVQNQLSDLRNAFVSVPGDSDPQSVSVQLGTRYPARVVAVNPGPPTGNLRTTGTDDPSLTFTIENARVDSDDETDDFWDSSSRSYRTGALVYRPNYNVYGQAPTTTYENSVLYNEFPSGTVTLADQTLVDGNRITLIAVNGSYDATRSGTVSPDLEPVSTSTRTVSVTDDGDPVTVEVPTRLSEETWRDLLAEEIENGHVRDDSVSVTDTGSEFETLSFELETGEEYTLQLAKVGIGSDVTETSEAYMTDVSGDGSTVVEGRSRLITVEVRDKYNNPKPGVRVEADADGGTLLDPEDSDSIVTTGTDGQAAFEYTADADAGGSDYELRFSTDDTSSNDATLSEFTESDATDVGMSVTVERTTSTATGNGGDGAYRTTWQNPSGQTGVTCDSDGDDCTLDASQETSVDLTAQTNPAATNAEIQFARNRTDLGSLSPTSTTTDSSGEAETTFTVSDNGETKFYATSGGSGDVVNLTVQNYSPAVRFRVDDISFVDTDRPRLLASFDVSNIANADSVEVEFQNTADGSATETITSSSLRGSLFYVNSYGVNDQYDVTVRVLDAGGNTINSETLTTDADATNPAGNDDLADSGDASLSSWDVTDEANTNSDQVEYEFTYDVGSGDFNEVKLVVLSKSNGGASATLNRTQTSGTDIRVPQPSEADYGTNNDYRLGIMVFDDKGAVVQLVTDTDTADGTSDPTLSAAALLVLAFGITGVRWYQND